MTSFELAAKHADKNTSAQLRYRDALSVAARGTSADLVVAHMVALDSLKHSVGVFHPDYIAAKTTPI